MDNCPWKTDGVVYYQPNSMHGIKLKQTMTLEFMVTNSGKLLDGEGNEQIDVIILDDNY